MSDSNSTSGGRVGFFGLLGVLFIGLKLSGVINWSWWLVLLPLYGGLAIVGIIIAAALLFSLFKTY